MKILPALALLFAAALGHAQTVVYVNPVTGTDLPNFGTQAFPVKTITFAATQTVTPPLVIKLEPGVYDQASGEQYPINLPADVEISGTSPCGAKLVHPLDPMAPIPNAVFRIFNAPGTGISVVFRDFRYNTPHRGLQIQAAAESPVSLVFDNVRGTTWRFLILEALKNVTGTVVVNDCTLTVVEHGLLLRQFAGSSLQVSVTDSSLKGSIGGQIYIDANGPGTSTTLFAANTVFRGAKAAIASYLQGDATVNTLIENCVFTDCGMWVIPPSDFAGAIIDSALFHNPEPVHVIRNSVFTGSVYQNDMPQWDSAYYTLENNLVSQPNLIGVGGNVTGDPLFVDADNGDFHLLPASPARDAGNGTAALPFDADGDPRLDPSGLSDLGVDEFYPRYVYFRPLPNPGNDARLRILGEADAAYLIFAAAAVNGAPFDSGVQLAGLYVPQPIATGTVPASGLAEETFAIPKNPAFSGLTLAVQAAYFEGPAANLTFSANAFEHVMCP